MKGDQHQYVMFQSIHLLFFPTVSVLVASILVSGVLSTIATAVVASIIM